MKEKLMKRNDYTMRDGKDAAIAKRRHQMGEAQHDSANAFVKREQLSIKAKGGRAPELKEKSMQFDAYMCNNGEHAQELARDITKGLDKEAFPVR